MQFYTCTHNNYYIVGFHSYSFNFVGFHSFNVVSLQCDKIRKRRVTVLGAFQLANSSSLEEAGLQITKAV